MIEFLPLPAPLNPPATAAATVPVPPRIGPPTVEDIRFAAITVVPRVLNIVVGVGLDIGMEDPIDPPDEDGMDDILGTPVFVEMTLPGITVDTVPDAEPLEDDGVCATETFCEGDKEGFIPVPAPGATFCVNDKGAVGTVTVRETVSEAD